MVSERNSSRYPLSLILPIVQPASKLIIPVLADITFINKKSLGMSIVFPYLSLYLLATKFTDSEDRSMKKRLLIILLLLLGLAACTQAAAEDPLAVAEEPGVVTVFKSPT